jgi:hypothetical protein
MRTSIMAGAIAELMGQIVRPAAIVAVACAIALPAPAQETPSEQRLEQVLADFVLAACRNSTGRVQPGLQAGSCTRLIDSGSLGPNDLVIAHILRGSARWRIDNPQYAETNRDSAVADFATAIRLNPQLAWTEFDRRVNGDLDPVLEGEPPRVPGAWPHYLYARGMAALRLGRANEGRADITRATEILPRIAEIFARHDSD